MATAAWTMPIIQCTAAGCTLCLLAFFTLYLPREPGTYDAYMMPYRVRATDEEGQDGNQCVMDPNNE